MTAMMATELNLLKQLADGKPYTGPLDTLTESCVDARELETRIRGMKAAGHVTVRDISINEEVVYVNELQATKKGLDALRGHEP